MQKILMVWAVSCCLLLPATLAWSGEHRLGGGVNYWVALEDLDEDDVDEGKKLVSADRAARS